MRERETTPVCVCVCSATESSECNERSSYIQGSLTTASERRDSSLRWRSPVYETLVNALNGDPVSHHTSPALPFQPLCFHRSARTHLWTDLGIQYRPHRLDTTGRRPSIIPYARTHTHTHTYTSEQHHHYYYQTYFALRATRWCLCDHKGALRSHCNACRSCLFVLNRTLLHGL